jgi:ubiquinone/menaquinone biosynthesis C-methylase UbiE
VRREYRPFPVEQARDDSHEHIDVPLMARATALPRGGDVLEIGCGGGCGLVALSRACRPRRLVGVDIDSALLAAAAARLARDEVPALLVQGDARRLPFPDAAFDAVVDFGTCWHIAEPGRALAEIARVLRPAGLFVYETRLNQLTSHPIRSLLGHLPWKDAPRLRPGRSSLLWGLRVAA